MPRSPALWAGRGGEVVAIEVFLLEPHASSVSRTLLVVCLLFFVSSAIGQFDGSAEKACPLKHPVATAARRLSTHAGSRIGFCY
jgi:hypothetical protein